MREGEVMLQHSDQFSNMRNMMIRIHCIINYENFKLDLNQLRVRKNEVLEKEASLETITIVLLECDLI